MMGPDDTYARCPSCGRPNPSHLTSCWGCRTPLPPRSGAPAPPTGGGPTYPGPGAPATGGGPLPSFPAPGQYPSLHEYLTGKRAPVVALPPVPPPPVVPPPVPPPAGRPTFGTGAAGAPSPWPSSGGAAPAYPGSAPIGTPSPEAAYPTIPPAYPPVAAYPTPTRRSRKRLYAIVAGVVAVAVILILVVVLHPPVKPSNIVGTPVPESMVVGPAEKAAALMSGGPWTIDAVLGLGLPSSYSGVGGLITNCSTVWENSSSIELPSTPSSATPGEEAFWLVAMTNASEDALLIDVHDISGVLVASNGVVVHGSCTSSFTVLGAVPSTVIDSTSAAAAADAAGGSTFLHDYPGTTIMLELLGPSWIVLYTTCNLMAPSGTGNVFEAAYWATNGTVLVSPQTTSMNCASA